MGKEKVLVVRVSRELEDKLKEYAKERDISVSEAVRELTEAGLKIKTSWLKVFLKFL